MIKSPNSPWMAIKNASLHRYLHILSRAKSHFKKYYIFPTFLCSNLYKNKSEPESEQKKEEIIENNNNGAYEYENNDTEQFFTKDRQTFSHHCCCCGWIEHCLLNYECCANLWGSHFTFQPFYTRVTLPNRM